MKPTTGRLTAGAICCMLAALQGPALGQTVIDEWASVQAPAAPAVKQVTVDPKTTALLLLDFNKQTCNAERRPRCVASILNVNIASLPRSSAQTVTADSPGVPLVDVPSPCTT